MCMIISLLSLESINVNARGNTSTAYVSRVPTDIIFLGKAGPPLYLRDKFSIKQEYLSFSCLLNVMFGTYILKYEYKDKIEYT